jgi:hypothetical protein
MKLKSIIDLLKRDFFWIHYPFTKIFHDFFVKRKLIKLFYTSNITKNLYNFSNKNEKLVFESYVSSKQDQKYFLSKKNFLKKVDPPQILDLARIYNLIKKEKPFTILEFGVGYSTLVMAQALYENNKKFKNNNKFFNNKKLRNSKMFKIYSVDNSSIWIKKVKKNIPNHLKKYINISHSEVYTTTINNEVCHLYKKIPDINPEFIYLDAPNLFVQKGNVNGISFLCPERTPISADLCLLESTLLPGTKILVDGRVNNVRFLERNLKRKYNFKWDRYSDVTLITLTEKRLGKLNNPGFEYY